MTPRSRFLLWLSLSITLVSRSALSDPDEGRFRLRRDVGSGVIEVVGLDRPQLDRLKRTERTPEQWATLLSVRMARGPGAPVAAPIVGRYEVIGETLRFTPRYPFLTGSRYVARFDPGASDAAPIEMAFTIPKPPPGKPTEVVAVYPTTGLLPENQLKFYIHFSAPMARGEAYRHLRLLDGSGRPVERPFLELGEELWDAGMTRLTLLFDPGRIKRGLKPREEEGPILEDGKSYTFVIDPAWPDASGRPLANAYRKAFRAGPPDETQPAVARWIVKAPKIGSRDPLSVTFPEPLDHAMLGHAIRVRAGDVEVTGRAVIGDREQSWRFIPDRPWPDAAITLAVDRELEDLAGNSPGRPFEVDAVGPRPPRPSTGLVVVPVALGKTSK